jgi:hypothetical protein
VALVNDELHEGLTADSLVRLLDELPDVERPEPAPAPVAAEPAAEGLTEDDQDVDSGGQEKKIDEAPGEESQS